MKIINFNVVEILQSLLDRSKTQTIRKAWKIENNYSQDMNGNEINTPWTIDKQSRFKVGEKVQIMWQQRSQYKYFCSECGIGLPLKDSLPTNSLHNICMPEKHDGIFQKKLGEVEITEVFLIKIIMENTFKTIVRRKNRRERYCELNIGEIMELIKLDGFKNHEDFWNYFKEAGEFWVYRWKRLKQG